MKTNQTTTVNYGEESVRRFVIMLIYISLITEQLVCNIPFDAPKKRPARKSQSAKIGAKKIKHIKIVLL